MTKQDAITYITCQIAQKAAELAPVGCLGSIKTSYKKDSTSVFMAFGTDSLSLIIATDVFNTGNVRVCTKVSPRTGNAVMETKDFIYRYGEQHSKTDMKRWCVERFEKKAAEALIIFRAEAAKSAAKRSFV